MVLSRRLVEGHMQCMWKNLQRWTTIERPWPQMGESLDTITSERSRVCTFGKK